MADHDGSSEPEWMATRSVVGPEKRRRSADSTTIVDHTIFATEQNSLSRAKSRGDHSSNSNRNSGRDLGFKPKRKRQVEGRSSGGLFSDIMQWFKSSPSTEQQAADKAKLLEKVESLKKIYDSAQKALDESLQRVHTLEQASSTWRRASRESRGRIVALENRIQNLKTELGQSKADKQSVEKKADRVINEQKIALKKSKSRTIDLVKKVEVAEKRLAHAYTATVSTFAEDVSRNLTDDVVRNKISSFFQGNFFSWCADVCVVTIAEQDQVMNHLRYSGLINDSPSYLDLHQDLKFDMNLSDGSSPLIILQAVLANRLCDLYLTNPFFFVDESMALMACEARIREGDVEAAVDWRIRTLAGLEATTPLSHESLANNAREFEQDFCFLLDTPNNESQADLTSLFTEFARLARELWQVRTDIGVFGMSWFNETPFQLGHPEMDGEPATVSSLGREIIGRPIGAVMWPLILSVPVVRGNEPWQTVVWSKARVWVSPKMTVPRAQEPTMQVTRAQKAKAQAQRLEAQKSKMPDSEHAKAPESQLQTQTQQPRKQQYKIREPLAPSVPTRKQRVKEEQVQEQQPQDWADEMDVD